MHSAAIFLDLMLGLGEFAVISRGLQAWLDRKSWAIWLAALVVSYIPLVGGAAALLLAILVLEWPWWIAGGIFVGGTIALAATGGIAAVLGQSSLF